VSSRLLIAGGGVAALEAALAVREHLDDRLDIELLAPEPRFWYRPLSVAEPFELGQTTSYELSGLAARFGASFTLGELQGVDAAAHEAETTVGTIPYDVLLVAVGALPADAVPGAITFRGPADTDRIRALLHEIETGAVRRVAFAVPWGAAWSLPLYELLLMTSAWIGARGIQGVELALVTPEETPLQVFGRAGSEAVRTLLDERGVEVVSAAYVTYFADGRLSYGLSSGVEADRVVALPRLRGPRLDGLPQTLDGFLSVDRHGRVRGLGDVYAAGDVTTFPIKQGGIAAQMADAAAEAIAARLGAEIGPEPFRPVLRGLLLTGGRPAYLRHVVGEDDVGDEVGAEPLWWPPAKIVGRHLAPFLADVSGTGAPAEPAADDSVVRIDVTLDEEEVAVLAEPRLEWRDDDGTVAEVMVPDPLVVAAEDNLGDAAASMRLRGAGSAAVVDEGRLVGIITSRDLLRALAGLVDLSSARVLEWMTVDPVAVPADTGTVAAVSMMDARGIHHLIVVEDDRPIGMVGYRQAVQAARARGLGLGL
jgi:sulfide:quinone oxidoreductase